MHLQDAIVISGVGLVTALGQDLEECVNSCLEGRSAVRELQDPELTHGEVVHAARYGDCVIADRLRRPKQQKFMNRSVRAAMSAALDAVSSSGASLSETDPERIGIYCGSGSTGLDFQEFLPAAAAAWNSSREIDPRHLGGRPSRAIDRFFSLRTLSNAAIGLISAELEARGPGTNYTQGETASTLALKTAFFDILEDRCDVAIAGGHDSLLQHSILASCAEANLLLKGRAGDHRCGIAPGEGAAFVVLEKAQRVLARNGRIHGEICGFGAATKTSWDVSEPSPDLKTAARVIGAALGARKCDFVVRRRTGLCRHDRCEEEELRPLLGESVATTGFKHLTGYVGAATGAVELVLGLGCAAKRRLPAIAAPVSTPLDVRLTAETPTGVLLTSNWTGQVATIAVRVA